MSSIEWDGKAGEWAAHSALTGRDYYGTTRERAAARRTEAEETYTRHVRKNPQDYTA